MIVGADFSHYQQALDWRRLGIRFAWLKSSEGAGNADPTYARKRADAKAVGVPTGAYHFVRPGSDPVTQARWWRDHAGAHGPGDLRPAIDLEVEGFDAAWLRRFATEARDLFGCQPILYTYVSYLHSHGWLAGFRDLDLWVAAYSPVRPSTPGWRQVAWQNTDRGPGGGDGNVADSLDALLVPTGPTVKPQDVHPPTTKEDAVIGAYADVATYEEGGQVAGLLYVKPDGSLYPVGKVPIWSNYSGPIVPLNAPITKVVVAPDWSWAILFAEDGGKFPLGNAPGALLANPG